MHRRFAIALAALGWGLIFHTAAAADTKPQPKHSDTAATQTASEPIRTTLDNGLRVVIIANHLAPVASSMVSYGVGGRDTPTDHPGLAHAAEHMMFQGSPGLSRDQNLALIAVLGGAANARTLTDFTQYYATVPAQYLGVLLHMQALHMAGADDTAKRWAKERRAIQNEVSGDLSNPAFRARAWLRQQLLAGTPLADTPLGTAKDFDTTDAQRIAAFHKAWYTPNNATLTVVGDLDPQVVLATIRKRFGDIPRRERPDHPSGHLDTLEPAEREFVTDSGIGSVTVGYRAPGQDEPQAMAALRLLGDILNDQAGPLTSRLVVTGQAPAAGASTTAYATASTVLVSASFRPRQDTDKLTEALTSVLREVGQHGVTAKQLAAAKRQEATSHASQEDSIPGLAQVWSTALMTGWDSPAQIAARVQSVSLEQINTLTQQIFATNKPVVAKLTPMGSGQVDSVAQTSNSADETLGKDHPPTADLPDWAADPLTELHVPKQTVAPVEADLDNGLKLIVVPSSDVQAVHVLGAVTSNPYLESPKGQMGVAGLVNQLMRFGTTEHGRLAFQQAAHDIGANISVGHQFAMTVMPSQLDAGLRLLAEGERQPAFPKRLFGIFKQNYAAAVPGVLASANHRSSQTMAAGLLPKDDPKLRQDTVEGIQSISYDDLKAYYQRVFRPDVTTLVVIGDLDPARVHRLVARHFGDWAAEGERPQLFLDPVPLNTARRYHVPDDTRSQDAVTEAELVDIRHTDEEFDALVLGNQILSGGMLNNRLYRALRLERGLVYQVGSTFSTSPHRTSFIVHYASAPGDVAAAERVIKAELNELREHPVSAATLRRAKVGLLRHWALSEYSADAIGRAIGRRAIEGLALDDPYRRAAQVPAIDAKRVQAAFKKWIRPEGFVTVVRGPTPDADH